MASMNCQADFAARYREYLPQHLHTTAIPHVCTFCCTVLGAATPSGWGVHTLRRVLHMLSVWIAHHSGARAGATAPGPCSWPDHLGPTGQPAACSCLAVVCHPMPACMCGTCRAAGDSARAYLLSLGCPGLVKPRQLSIWTRKCRGHKVAVTCPQRSGHCMEVARGFASDHVDVHSIKPSSACLLAVWTGGLQCCGHRGMPAAASSWLPYRNGTLLCAVSAKARRMQQACCSGVALPRNMGLASPRHDTRGSLSTAQPVCCAACASHATLMEAPNVTECVNSRKLHAVTRSGLHTSAQAGEAHTALCTQHCLRAVCTVPSYQGHCTARSQANSQAITPCTRLCQPLA